uniref:GG11546 n=1 Tax=Drosophila erecta TaxID=7220 RepID=B3P620_DROER
MEPSHWVVHAGGLCSCSAPGPPCKWSSTSGTGKDIINKYTMCDHVCECECECELQNKGPQ